MTIKEIKAALQIPGTVFTHPTKLDGEKEFVMNEEMKFNYETDELEGTGMVNSINENGRLGVRGMNIKKFGPKCVSLYTFDMMGNKTVGMIKYENVKILETKEFIFVDGQKIGK
jgi:hypothetical protein